MTDVLLLLRAGVFLAVLIGLFFAVRRWKSRRGTAGTTGAAATPAAAPAEDAAPEKPSVLAGLRAARGMLRAAAPAKPMQVVGRQGLGAKASVVMIEVDGVRQLLGVTEHQVTLLQAPAAPVVSVQMPAMAAAAPAEPAPTPVVEPVETADAEDELDAVVVSPSSTTESFAPEPVSALAHVASAPVSAFGELLRPEPLPAVAASAPVVWPTLTPSAAPVPAMPSVAAQLAAPPVVLDLEIADDEADDVWALDAVPAVPAGPTTGAEADFQAAFARAMVEIERTLEAEVDTVEIEIPVVEPAAIPVVELVETTATEIALAPAAVSTGSTTEADTFAAPVVTVTAPTLAEPSGPYADVDPASVLGDELRQKALDLIRARR